MNGRPFHPQGGRISRGGCNLLALQDLDNPPRSSPRTLAGWRVRAGQSRHPSHPATLRLDCAETPTSALTKCSARNWAHFLRPPTCHMVHSDVRVPARTPLFRFDNSSERRVGRGVSYCAQFVFVREWCKGPGCRQPHAFTSLSLPHNTLQGFQNYVGAARNTSCQIQAPRSLRHQSRNPV